MRADQLEDLWKRFDRCRRTRCRSTVTPPRATRFGSPLVLARVHWVRSELVVEVAYLTWTVDGLLGFVGQSLPLHELRVAEREARKE